MAVVFSSWSESDDMVSNSDNAMSVYFKIIVYSCAGGLTMHKHELIMCSPINGSWASAHKIIICSYTGLMTTVGGAGVACPVRLGGVASCKLEGVMTPCILQLHTSLRQVCVYV